MVNFLIFHFLKILILFRIYKHKNKRDRLSYKQAAEFIESKRSSGKSPTEAAQLLVKDSLDRGTMDNVTAIVVYLTPPKISPLRKSAPSNESTENGEEMDIYEFLKKEAEKKGKEGNNEKNKEFEIPADEEILEGFKIFNSKLFFQFTFFI